MPYRHVLHLAQHPFVVLLNKVNNSSIGLPGCGRYTRHIGNGAGVGISAYIRKQSAHHERESARARESARERARERARESERESE